MSFILDYFISNNGDQENKATIAELEGIEKLKTQLVEVGFAPGEVDCMIRNNIKHKKKSLTQISSLEIKKVNKALADQLEMSIRCLNLTKEQ